MKSQKLVSVCINAYNCSATIGETIQSVISQTYENMQIIIVDDCSTDNTVEVIKSFDDERIELYCLEKNGNISNANNECLRHARGEYIAHLDSDDIWVEDKIEKQVKFLDENPQYGACFSHAGFIRMDSTVITEENITPDLVCNLTVYLIDNMSQAEFLRLFYDTLNHICHCSMVMRKSVYEAVGNHDLTMRFLHDFDYWVRMVQHCPIYIMQENLVYCRVRGDNNSVLGPRELIEHNEELARVAYKLVNDCTDEMFLEAFADRLRLKGEHTHEETELERAFVLENAILLIPDNKVLMIKKLNELFTDKKYVELAEEKFGFTLRDFYELHKDEIFYDAEKVDALNNERRQLSDRLSETENLLSINKAYYGKKMNELNTLSAVYNETKAQLDGMTSEYTRVVDEINALTGTIWYKLVSPFIKLKRAIKGIKNLFTRKTYDGKRACAKIMLYGYYRHNVGDDVFFDMLFKRYPDTLFCIMFEPDYAKFFSKYPNVRFYDTTRPIVARINAIGNRFGKPDLFERILLYAADGAMHIGGSIYQQVGNWQLDFNVRKRRKRPFRKFFAISNNFGPYKTDGYKDMWKKEFEKWTDICFRDKYSYELFSDLKQVRYAPDLLFSYPVSKYPTEKKVSISLINAFLEGRSFSKTVCRNYEKALAEMIEKFANDGYEISLLSFCEYEQDPVAANKIVSQLPEDIAKKVKIVLYTDDLSVITDEIAKSEYVIATRFHAMVLGYISGKKVLPLCYSKKVSNVIEDLELSENIVNLESIDDYTADELITLANSISDEKISSLKLKAEEQFAGFDKYINKKRGKIIK